MSYVLSNENIKFAIDLIKADLASPVSAALPANSTSSIDLLTTQLKEAHLKDAKDTMMQSLTEEQDEWKGTAEEEAKIIVEKNKQIAVLQKYVQELLQTGSVAKLC